MGYDLGIRHYDGWGTAAIGERSDALRDRTPGSVLIAVATPRLDVLLDDTF
jgi:hypothetical protein